PHPRPHFRCPSVPASGRRRCADRHRESSSRTLSDAPAPRQGLAPQPRPRRAASAPGRPASRCEWHTLSSSLLYWSGHHGGAPKRIEDAPARAFHVVANESERLAAVAALNGIDYAAVLGVEVGELQLVPAGHAHVGETIELVD